MTFSAGEGLDVETTSLAATALMKDGRWPETVKEALSWISAHKQPHGDWGYTQATLLAMRALLRGSRTSLGQDQTTEVSVVLDGAEIETFRITRDDSDVMRQVNLAPYLRPGENRLELRQQPAGELPCQVSGVYWRPEPPRQSAPASSTEPLQIDVQYNRATLAVNDQVQCAVIVQNKTGQDIPMAMVDIGIPPGFEVDASPFETLQASGQIARFERTTNQAILYLTSLAAGEPLRFAYSLRAKYPLRVKTPPSSVYEYYQPDKRAESRTTELVVRK